MNTELKLNPLETAAKRLVLVAPLGDHSHQKGIQRLDEAAARTMIRHFRGLWEKLKRAVVGCPLYLGHPDCGTQGETLTRDAVYGTVKDLVLITDDDKHIGGLYAELVLTEGGLRLVQAGIRWLSPHWQVEEVGITETGVPIYRPVKLLSIGLTTRPNLPGQTLDSDNEQISMETFGRKTASVANSAPLLLKQKPISSALHERYAGTIGRLSHQESITQFIREQCKSGTKYDDAFARFFPKSQ